VVIAAKVASFVAVFALLALPPLAHAAFPGANGKIVFYSNRDDPDPVGCFSAGNCNFDIYSMNADGSGITRLTDDPAADIDPVWSPDGAKIAFQRCDAFCEPNGSADVWVMNADGSGETMVIAGMMPAWSPDGTKLAFRRTVFPSGLVVADADGTGLDQLDSVGQNPAWSADGRRIAYFVDAHSQWEIFAISPDGSSPAHLTQDTFGGNTMDNFPNYSPDGERIVFETDRAPNEEIGTGDLDLYTMGPDGSNPTVVGPNPVPDPGDDVQPSWSPDGRLIAFSRTTPVGFNYVPGPGADIRVMNADGSNPVSLTNDAAVDGHPDWQPLGGLDRYPRPGGGTPYRVPLVPAYRVCGSASNPQNSNHVAPLALDSCSPPIIASETLTTGTTGNMAASARLDVVVGNPSTPADEADVGIQAQASDVRCGALQQVFPGCTAAGADYTGKLILTTVIRLTDGANGFGGVSGTVENAQLSFPMACTTTPASSNGSTCAVSTTSDTVIPGFAKEGKRMILSTLSLRVRDSGADGDIGDSSPGCPPTCGTGDERTFLDQGIFLP
jgi:TolB protein